MPQFQISAKNYRGWRTETPSGSSPPSSTKDRGRLYGGKRASGTKAARLLQVSEGGVRTYLKAYETRGLTLIPIARHWDTHATTLRGLASCPKRMSVPHFPHQGESLGINQEFSITGNSGRMG